MPHGYPPPWAYGRQYQSPPHSATYPPPNDPWTLPGPDMLRWSVPYHPPQWTTMTYAPPKSWGPAPPMPPMGSFAMPQGSMAWPRAVVPAQPAPSANSIQQAPLPMSPRGPPCKPRQSGWAIWVGNLPPSTTVIHLKDYFSQQATDDILSVFLISKTNCAFVNYRSEAACLATIDRVDGAQFRGNRLVCRIRRDQSNSNSGSASLPPSQSNFSSPPQSNNSSEGSMHSSDTADDGPLIVQGDQKCARVDSATGRSNSLEVPSDALERLSLAPKVPARVFILKSLTLQDLLVSTRDGTWVTQAHNEAKLNAAFAAADAVYLVFSVNKSGQYFGYARMEAVISGPTEATPTPTSPAPNPSPPQRHHRGPDVPLSIPTPATATAPAGRVMDDSARGTIFWEAAPATPSDIPPEAGSIEPDSPTSPAAEGRQFAIRWLSTTPVPFHATRGLRNPLNGNREVKIARDGTEVEARVGGRLLRLFHSRDGAAGCG